MHKAGAGELDILGILQYVGQIQDVSVILKGRGIFVCGVVGGEPLGFPSLLIHEEYIEVTATVGGKRLFLSVGRPDRTGVMSRMCCQLPGFPSGRRDRVDIPLVKRDRLPVRGRSHSNASITDCRLLAPPPIKITPAQESSSFHVYSILDLQNVIDFRYLLGEIIA